MVPLTFDTDVLPEGWVQVRLPEEATGRRVRVTVEEFAAVPTERVFGRLKGMIEIMPGFKDPIPGFE